MAKLHLFPQIARKIPLEIVKAAEEKYKSNKGCQYLDVLTHLLSFLLCHLGDCQSLRDVCNAMKCFQPNLKELGIERTPSRNAPAVTPSKSECQVPLAHVESGLFDSPGYVQYDTTDKMAG